jgi:hypothetical protein
MTSYKLNFHKLNYPDLSRIPYPHPTQQTRPDQTLADSIRELQSFYPVYPVFFELNDSNYNQIGLNHRYQIVDLETVYDNKDNCNTDRSVFIKYSPLLDPIKYMVGKYDLNDAVLKKLPKWSSTKKDTNVKLLNPMNASYTDTLFCFLSSILKNQLGFQHGIDFYGTFLGIQDKYCMNVEEDLDYLLGSSFFHKHLGKDIVLENFNQEILQNAAVSMGSSRKMKQKVNIVEENLDLDLGIVEILGSDVGDVTIDQMPITTPDVVYEKVKSGSVTDNMDGDEEGSGSGSDSYDNSSDSDSTNTEDCIHQEDEEDQEEDAEEEAEAEADEEDQDDDDDEWETESEETASASEEQKEALAYISDFPVQLICLEKCKDTFDSLLVRGIPIEECASALFQIIMILLTYQKIFRFTHNDLHTNNIMFVETDQPFLYYKYQNNHYKVPTYGRIYKIIDYGRAIYRFKKQIFCSDSFAPGGDASTQYNCEPFLKSNKPILEPNPSFDLCRLGCSIYDFIFDSDSIPKNETMEKNDFERTIQRWCTDDYNRNVLYKKNGEERYPGFRLYKMIARTVHKHTPEQQLEDPWFRQFLVRGGDFLQDDPSIMDIDSYSIL